jgi:hypothetical protein
MLLIMVSATPVSLNVVLQLDFLDAGASAKMVEPQLSVRDLPIQRANAKPQPRRRSLHPNKRRSAKLAVAHFHQSSPVSVHFPRFALFSFAFLIDLSEIITT